MSSVFDEVQTFNYTGSSQTFEKPKDVTTVFFQVKGGGGGGSLSSQGGGGAYVFTKYSFLNKDVSNNIVINVGSGGKSSQTRTGGITIGGSSSEFVNGGNGTTSINNTTSGGGGGMSSVFFSSGNKKIIEIVAGGGGGGGGNSGGRGGDGGEIGSSGQGDTGGIGGNTDGDGNGGLGTDDGGVNGFNYISSITTDGGNSTISFIGGGGGGGGTFEGGGGGAGYGGGASGKTGGGGGGGSTSIGGDLTFYTAGKGGKGGSINSSGENGSVIIGYFKIVNFPPSIVPMYLLDPQHTSRSNYEAPSRIPATVESIQTQSSSYYISNSIVMDNDQEIYFISSDGYLYKYNHNNVFVWSFKDTNSKFIDAPAVGDNRTIYACSTTTDGSSSYLYAIIDDIDVGLGTINAQVKWVYEVSGNCVGSPILDTSGNIYVGTTSGSIYKISDISVVGEEKWKYYEAQTSVMPYASVALSTDQTKLYYLFENTSTLDFGINLLDISDPDSVSRINQNEVVGVPYCISINNNSGSNYKNDVYIIAGDSIRGYNSDLNTNRFDVTINSNLFSNLAIGSDDKIYFTSFIALHVFDIAEEEIVWNYEILNEGYLNVLNSTPIIDANNHVYFGTHNNYIVCVDPDTKRQLWRYNAGGTVISPPLIGPNTTIKFLANDGKLYSLSGNGTPQPTEGPPEVQMLMLNEKHTGKSRYKGPTTTTIPTVNSFPHNVPSGNLYILPSMAISADGKHIYLGGSNGLLYSFNTESYELDWSANLVTTNSSRNLVNSNSIFTSPLISSLDGTIYVGSYNGYLHAVDLSGNKKWSYVVDFPFQSSPIIDTSGTIFFGAGEKMYAIRDNNVYGNSYWLTPFSADGKILTSPAISNDYDTLYFGSDYGSIYALNRTTGEKRWEFKLDIDQLYTTASIDNNNNVIIGSTTNSTMVGTLLYLDGSNNSMTDLNRNIWSITSPTDLSANIGPFFNTVAVNDSTDTLYLSTIAYTYAINRGDGGVKWRYRKRNFYYTSVIIDDNDNLLFCSMDIDSKTGYLHMITDNDNSYTENWKLQVSTAYNERLSPPVIGSNGTIYISSNAGKVYYIE